MGYIHNCALRWSLQREGKLQFSANLRLLTSARHNAANAWYANIVYLAGIVLSYSSTSLIFLSLSHGLANLLGYTGDGVDLDGGATEFNENEMHLNPIAVITLGGGLIMQAVVATWALTATDMPCWSSNPLDVVRECTQEADADGLGHRVSHRVGRSMMGVHMAAENRCLVQPHSPQPPMITAHHSVRWVFALIAVLPVASGIWGGVAYALIARGDPNGVLGASWSLLPDFGGTKPGDGNGCPPTSSAASCTTGTSVLNIGWSAYSDVAGSVASFFYIAAFQAALTLSLHCAELLVNLSRDEAVFRKLTSSRGTDGHTSSIRAALTSWETVTLFCFKAALHWMFGLAINVSYQVGINMYPPQIVYFSGLCLIVALFVAFLAFRHRRGYLPSTFGHIQTISDLVDEWADSGCMFWGHKADGLYPGDPSYAGTSTKYLHPPYPDRLYGGVPAITRDELMYRLGYDQAAALLSQQMLQQQQQQQQDQQRDPAELSPPRPQRNRLSRVSHNSMNGAYTAHSGSSGYTARSNNHRYGGASPSEEPLMYNQY